MSLWKTEKQQLRNLNRADRYTKGIPLEMNRQGDKCSH